MNRKIISLILCAALLIPAAGCSGSGKAESSAASEATVVSQEEAVEQNEPETDTETDAEIADESSAAGTEAGALNSISEASSDEEEEYNTVYAFASVKYSGNNAKIVPNGTVNDETVLYNEKTLGGLCDYIDNTVLEEGRTINRKFLYGLVSTQVIDPGLMQTYAQFSNVMLYCLTIANEFHNMDITLNDVILDSANNTQQKFEVTAEGKENTWILDGHSKKLYLNDGATEYESTMFDDQTMAVWSFVLDEYFKPEG